MAEPALRRWRIPLQSADWKPLLRTERHPSRQLVCQRTVGYSGSAGPRAGRTRMSSLSRFVVEEERSGVWAPMLLAAFRRALKSPIRSRAMQAARLASGR